MRRFFAKYKTEALLSLAFWGLVASLAFVARSSGASLFTDSPAATIAQNAKHLWQHGNLRDPRYDELRAELEAGARANPGKQAVQDVFAVGRDGQLYPKHSILAALVSIPFYVVFGDFGFWLANQIALFLILAGVYTLGKRLGSSFAAAIVLGALPLTAGYFLVFSYLPLYDFIPACCVIWSFLLLEKRPWLAGFVFSLALWVRMSELFFFPFVLLSLGRPALQHAKAYRRAALGLASGLIPLMGANAWLWGAPLSGAYVRLVYFENGEMILDPVSHTFGLQYLADLKTRLLDESEGVLTRLPLWGVAPLFLLLFPRGRDRWLAGAILSAACGYFAVMMTFSFWIDQRGPRLIFTATALLMVIAIYFVHRLLTPPAQRQSGPAPG